MQLKLFIIENGRYFVLLVIFIIFHTGKNPLMIEIFYWIIGDDFSFQKYLHSLSIQFEWKLRSIRWMFRTQKSAIEQIMKISPSEKRFRVGRLAAEHLRPSWLASQSVSESHESRTMQKSMKTGENVFDVVDLKNSFIRWDSTFS